MQPVLTVVVQYSSAQCTRLTRLQIPFPARRLITAMPRLALCSHAQAMASADLVEAPAGHAAADPHVPSSKSICREKEGVGEYDKRLKNTTSGQEQS